jgi:IS5 family transposase
LGSRCGRRCCRRSCASCRRSSGAVDGLLDEDRFLEPFRRRLTATTGRPTIPIETYLRLAYLKHRYDLGWETLCREVSDSFTWRRFCRIALDGRVPDPSTLMKLTKRLGPELLDELNAELLSLAVERKVLRSRRLRVDTTVVEADVRRPTDSGLCAHAVSRLARLGRRIKATGAAGKARLRDRGRSVGKRVRAISALGVRGRDARAAIDRLTAEIAKRARDTVREARTIAERAGRSRRPRARVLAASSSASSRRPSRSSPRPPSACKGSARSPTGASRLSTRTPARSGWAARGGRPSSVTRRASPTPPRAS